MSEASRSLSARRRADEVVLDIGMGEFLGLAVVALLVLGPDKLPKFAADAARFIHQLRKMANTARDDVRRELGPELQGI